MRTATIEQLFFEGGTITKTSLGVAIISKGGKRAKITEEQSNYLQNKYNNRLQTNIETGIITYKLKLIP